MCLKLANKFYLVHKYNLNNAIYSQETIEEISNRVFKEGTKDYMYIVGLGTLWGWVPNNDDDIIKQKILAWVNNDFRPTYNGSYSEFLDRFRTEIRNILFWKDGTLKHDMSAIDFCTNIADTGTTGSAYDPGGPRSHIIFKDEDIPVSNNKFAKSGALSVAEKMKRLFARERQIANASVKVEFFPKIRMIISAGYNITLKMRYVDTWLRRWMRGYRYSTLYQTKEQALDMWINFSKMLGWNIPIDQSAFDHKITKDMVLIITEEHTNLYSKRATNNVELVLVAESIEYALDGGYIIWTDSKGVKHKFQYLSGILSGWQHTAHYDTIANLAELAVAVTYLKEMGFTINIILKNAQGDDVLLTVDELITAILIVCAIRSFGFTIHPKKTFFSTHHNEYLRKYSINNEINGYPARMVNNLLWIYPGQQPQVSLIEKLSSYTSKWQKFGDRMHFDQDITNKFITNDLAGAKVNREIIRQYMSTHPVYGGSGQLPITKEQLKIDQHQPNINGRVKITDPGYEAFKLRYGKYQSRELESWYLKVIELPSVYKGVEVKQETEPDLEIITIDEPIPFNIVETHELPSTFDNHLLPENVIFGQSRDLLQTRYPYIDTFTNNANAPKSWVYSYLSGHLKQVSPYIPGLSSEFSSLVWSKFAASIINAMYYKRSSNNKWQRLQLYAYNNFHRLYSYTVSMLPKMY